MFASLVAAAAGTLVIVGGALDPGNDPIFAAFIAAIPGKDATIAVIPAASATPATSAQFFADDLIRHKIAANRIVTVRIATQDDPATPGVDEAQWRGNASDPAEIAKIEQAGAIWFSGGDQARIVATLVARDGSDTPMLSVIRKRLAAGAVVGGSSAGAAIMSAPMILQGDSLGALLPAPSGEQLKVGSGLGFFAAGLVDQHFNTRARLGRLSVALSMLPPAGRLGYGIDEDTALVVDLAHGTARAIGTGYVTLLDARNATYRGSKRMAAEGLVLGLASGGDTIDLRDQSITPATYKNFTVGHESVDRAALDEGGMALPGETTAAVIGEGLIDNRGANRIDRLSFSGNRGIVYRFAKLASSRGWWGRDGVGTARYAIEGICFSILPVDLIIKDEAR
jgi:cyanophycinase